MKKACLNYITKDKKILTLNSSSLYEIDKHTRCFNNAKEIISKYKNKINTLNEENLDGILKIFYYKSQTEKEVIPIMYKQSSPIYIKDDYITNNISEIEKAKRLLFNSKSDLFISLFLNHKILRTYSYYYFEVMDFEQKILNDANVSTIIRDNIFYVRLDSLLKYKLINKKLGPVRNIYESILDAWKANIESMDEDELYFISRQMRLLFCEYDVLRKKIINICKLKVHKNTLLIIDNYKLLHKQKNNRVIFV